MQSPLSHSRDIPSLCHLHLYRQLHVDEGDTALWFPHILSLELCMEQMQRPPQHLPGPSLLHSTRSEVEPERLEHLPANGAHCLQPSLTKEDGFILAQDKDIDLVCKRTFISKLRPQKQKLPSLTSATPIGQFLRLHSKMPLWHINTSRETPCLQLNVF